MELFIPGLFLFFLAIGISFFIIPKFTPLVVTILSIVVLVVAVRQHYKMFESEYRLSTWQESFKVYAPAIMIGAIILFIMYFILSIFTKGSVPIPNIPNIEAASPDSATNQVVESLNQVANSISNTTSNIVSNVVNRFNESTGINYKKNKNGNNISRSFLEVL